MSPPYWTSLFFMSVLPDAPSSQGRRASRAALTMLPGPPSFASGSHNATAALEEDHADKFKRVSEDLRRLQGGLNSEANVRMLDVVRIGGDLLLAKHRLTFTNVPTPRPPTVLDLTHGAILDKSFFHVRPWTSLFFTSAPRAAELRERLSQCYEHTRETTAALEEDHADKFKRVLGREHAGSSARLPVSDQCQ